MQRSTVQGSTARRHFCAVAVEDLSTAAWYADSFGLAVLVELRPADGSVVTVLQDDALVVELKRRPRSVPRDPEACGFYKVGWFVTSVDAERDRLVTAGVRASEVVEQPELGLRFFLVEDPEGNTVQLFEGTGPVSPR